MDLSPVRRMPTARAGASVSAGVPAAKAATAALTRQVGQLQRRSRHERRGRRGAEEAMAAAVVDSSGALAAAAAEVTCWEATEMPEELQGLLREHCTAHIRLFGQK